MIMNGTNAVGSHTSILCSDYIELSLPFVNSLVMLFLLILMDHLHVSFGTFEPVVRLIAVMTVLFA